MANTPAGYEITDFLTELQGVGEANPKYNSFVRKYTRYRKNEIKRAERERYSQHRIRFANSIAGLLLMLGWAAFFGSIFYLAILPVIRAKQMSWSAVFHHINNSHGVIITVIAVALFCFAAHFKQVSFRVAVNVMAGLWCAFMIVASVSNLGPYMDINSPAWIVFGKLLLTFALVNVFSSRLGSYLHVKIMEEGEFLKDIEHVFTPIEVVFLVFMILVNGAGLYFLIDTNRFYAITDAKPVIRIIIAAIPVVIFILYCIWHANRREGESVDAWFCTTMEVFTTALILQIFAVPNLLRGLMLWIGLILISIVVLVYMGNIIGGPMAYLSIGMISLNFIVSASINYYSEEAGTSVLGVATHWWMVAPAILTVGLAIFATIREMVREKL